MTRIGTFRGDAVYSVNMKEYLEESNNGKIVFWVDGGPLVKKQKVIAFYDGNKLTEVDEPYWFRDAVSVPQSAEGLEEKNEEDRDEQVYSAETANDYSEYSKVVDEFFKSLN